VLLPLTLLGALCMADAPAEAGFVGFDVTTTVQTSGGVDLIAYRLWARFNGPTDTVLNAFGLTGGATTGFWHSDVYSSGLSQVAGTWCPSLTVAAPALVDSYVTIGGVPGSTNGTVCPEPYDSIVMPTSWSVGAEAPTQGRVGSAGNTATSVILAQFVLLASDLDPRLFQLTIGYNSGNPGGSVQFASGSFVIPEPGAGLLCALALLAGRGRRRGEKHSALASASAP